MRKTFTVVLAGMLALALSTLVVAAEKKEAHMKVVGEVMAVDIAAKTFTVKEQVKGGEPKELTFNLDEKARITIHGKKATLADLRVGDPVTVKYHEHETRIDAEDVTVSKPAKTS